MNYQRTLSIIYYIGMVLVVIATVAALSNTQWAPYLLAAGVAPIVAIRIHNRVNALPDFQRINTILLASSLILAGGVVALFFGKSYWVVCLFTTAMLDIYASFRRLA